MKPKISVIVPMYNVEKYIRMCIESILNQTFKDFELILVDDCSTDKTLEIAKSFNDRRIKIIENKINSSFPGISRNIGLAQAQGEYIYFMDSDDVILPQALDILFNNINNLKIDFVDNVSFYEAENNDFQTLEEAKLKIIYFSDVNNVANDINSRLIEEICQNRISCVVWQKLFRRDFLIDKNIKFREIYTEDVVFQIELLCATDNIVKFDNPFYIHRKVQNSESNNLGSDFNKLRSRVKNLLNLSEVIENIIPNAIKSRQGGGNYIINYVAAVFLQKYFDSQIFPFFYFSPETVFKIIDEELTAKNLFENNNKFITAMLYAFISDRAIAKNTIFMNNNLKSQIKNIYEKIGELIK